MITDIILISVALLILIISSIWDLRTREVPDNLTIGLIVIALVIRLIHSIITREYTFFLYGLLGFGIMFIIALIMYRTKQWGGADAKLLMGFGAAFGTAPYFSNLTLPFLLILFLNVIIIGGLYGLIFAIVLYFKNRKKANPLLKKELIKKRRLRNIILMIAVMILISSILIPILTIKALLIILALFLMAYFYISIFVKIVEKLSFIKQLPLERVTEGDWLAKDVYYKNKVLISKKHPCLTLKDIKLMKKNKIRNAWVKIGIPFVPAMLIATIVTILVSIMGF
ncbi:prepilin peptidase [archaeon]|jgi:Flp pilus assembly protein protease CpaA|nr:prepilin peptidase [archaeon]MBT4396968.1 prepilin peptidase [archaeon]MBT4440959.1 prepilin peptidase [archaeon]